MIKVFTVNNPYDMTDVSCDEFHSSISIADVGSEYIDKPYLCHANIEGKRYYPTRDEWEDIVLNHGDSVYFIPKVAGGEILTYVIVAIIAAVVSYALTPDPPDVKINNLGEADPVFNLTGEKNQIRLNQPIEDAYGRCNLWPSVAAISYNQYVDNEQILYQLLCLGQGSYSVENVFIEDTPIGNFNGVEYALYGPNEQVTLFRDNVVTSSEVGRIELFGPNEPLYTGASGPYVANDIGTKTDKLEWDLEFPQGLKNNTTVTATIEYQEIDNSGNALGPWLTIAFTQTADTFTPQRFTVTQNVTQGRYHSRVTRTSNKNTDANVPNLLQWTGLKAFLTSATDYGDVTILAIKAKADNNLNDRSSQKFNCIATRKLPIYNGTTIPAVNDTVNRTVTRNPVWAFVNIFRSHGIADEYIDLAGLLTEATYATTNNIDFDFIYDQKSTIWEAAKLPAFVMRATPVLQGSKVTWIRDTGSQFPTFFINPENTLKNSFKVQKKLFDLNDYDGLEVEYKDEKTFNNETILCVVGNQLGLNPKKTVIRGVQDRQKAFELGVYQWAKEVYEREIITLSTGLEGYIASFGDVVRIASDITESGQSGYITNINGSVLTLSEDVVFTVGQTHQIAIRGKEGQELGPYTCIAGTVANEIDISPSFIPAGQTFLDYQHEPPLYIFGVTNTVGKICRITDIIPSGDAIEVKAIADDSRRLTNPGTAPAIGETVNGYPGAVTFDPPAGSYLASVYPISVTITKQNSLATIRWSKTAIPVSATDGTEYTTPVSVSSGETLYARAFLSNTFAGAPTTGAYTTYNPALQFNDNRNSQYIGVM